MTEIKELVDAYLAHKGMKKVKGRDDDFSPLLPLVMMDSAKTIWNEAFKTIPCKFEVKKYKKEWEKNYHAFCMDYFRCFNDEQTDYIIDKMDEYESYIANDVMITKCAIMDCLPDDESFERRVNLASLLLVNILVQSAIIVWGRVYQTRTREGINHELTLCKKCGYEAMNAYYGNDKPHINCNENDKACKCVDVLCGKLINFIRICYEQKQ